MRADSLGVPLVALAAAAALVPHAAVELRAQEPPERASITEDANFPANTVVVRFDLPEDALAEVTSSAELVAALREHWTVDVARPLDEPLQVDLRGFAGDMNGKGTVAYFLMNGLRYEGDEPLDDFSLAAAMRESHGEGWDDDGWDEFDNEEWTEDKAWNTFVEALDVGLRQSSELFGSPAGEGHAGLRVKAMHLLPFAFDDQGGDEFYRCCEEIEGPVLEIKPDVRYPSAMASGGAAEPLRHERTVLVIELEPGPTAGPSAGDGTAAAADSPTPAVAPEEVSANLERLELTQLLLAACDGGEIRDRGTSEIALLGERRNGDAVYGGEEEGELFVMLGSFEEGLDRCLVFFSPGGLPAPGEYPLRAPAEDLMFAETPPPGTRPFFAALATNMGATSTTHMGRDARLVVVTGGTLEISEVEQTLRATFELEGWITPEIEGWIAAGETDGEPVELTGSFEAVRATP